MGRFQVIGQKGNALKLGEKQGGLKRDSVQYETVSETGPSVFSSERGMPMRLKVEIMVKRPRAGVNEGSPIVRKLARRWRMLTFSKIQRLRY